MSREGAPDLAVDILDHAAASGASSEVVTRALVLAVAVRAVEVGMPPREAGALVRDVGEGLLRRRDDRGVN